MFEWLSDPEAWAALATLTMLEIVLGIDNIIFISLLVSRLPVEARERTRVIGLGLAMIMRIGLLLSLSWVLRLTEPLATIAGFGITGRDLVLVLGGLFLVYKATTEIHHALEGAEHAAGTPGTASVAGTLIQIAIIDIVFSLDSVITAIGMAHHVSVMVIAIVIAVLVMLFASVAINTFIEKHPTLKVLALSFLLLVGTALIADGMHFHIPKGYLYFAMAFSIFVEIVNIRMRTKAARPVTLRASPTDPSRAEP